jgi:predicted Zn-dependent protease with MMP-like domain
MGFQKYLPFFVAGILIVVLVWTIKKQVEEYTLQKDPLLTVLKDILTPVKYNGQSITKNLKLYKGEKSYTINKTQTFLCLHDEKQEYYPLNMLIYVLLHEIAHSLNTKDIGHTEEFYRIFDILLAQAEELEIYNSEIPVIQNYCNSEHDE